MRSRAARLTFSATAWIAISAAGLALVVGERRISTARAAFRAFDGHAREASDALSDVRVGQQAYVATGQGVGFWMPKVGATMDAAAEAVTLLRRSAISTDALSSLDDAASAITNLRGVDTRARDYLQSGQPLMAGDVLFTEGDQTVVEATHAVEQARIAEWQALDQSEAQTRRLEGMALAAAGALAALAVLLLMPRQAGAESSTSLEQIPESTGSLSLKAMPPPSTPAARQPSPASDLTALARLCTDLGRVHDVEELQRLLSRTAGLMDASGLVVWMGDLTGGDLKPLLAHGYSGGVLARMPAVPRAANNAAAAAYRMGTLQIVLSKSPASNGAIVAPILTTQGCIGALSAEIKAGTEVSEHNQAIAALVAAHLASVLGPAESPAPAGSAGASQAAAG